MSGLSSWPTGIHELAGLPFYTEGPAIDEDGNVYVTTISGRTIVKIDAGGNLSEWAKGGYPNGQIILPGGDHLVCDSKNADIKRYNKEGTFLCNEINGCCAGEKIFTPNDLVADSIGNVYFTDSVRHMGKVCMFSVDGKERTLAANLDYPNGVALSQDEKWLFVAESYKNRILKIDLTNKEKDNTSVLVDLPVNLSGKQTDNLPDGLTMSADGTLWVAHYGMQAIHNYSTDGRFIRSYDTRLPLTSNLIFADEKTLIITGGYAEPGPGKVLKIFL